MPEIADLALDGLQDVQVQLTDIRAGLSQSSDLSQSLVFLGSKQEVFIDLSLLIERRSGVKTGILGDLFL